MRELEEEIAEWRRQMIRGGIKSARVLDELESHLRDDTAEQTRAGSSVAEAFGTAVQRLGDAAVLELEFDKVAEPKEAAERMKQVFCTFAGIPHQYLTEPMNTPPANIEPRWATYVKATSFLLPALCLWLLSIVFLIPKLQQICLEAGGHPLPLLIQAMIAMTRNGVFICGGIILLLGLLEWRSSYWPRYRRAAVSLGAFLLNAVVLISFFMMVVTAVLVAPALLQHGK
jgi:hypothetical protein